jgi:hypothetical protein
MAMFLLDVGLKTGSWVIVNTYYGVRYLIWGHEETEMEKVDKRLGELQRQLEKLATKVDAGDAEQVVGAENCPR